MYQSLKTLALLITGILSVSSEEQRIVCYWNSWSVYRNGQGKFIPELIDPDQCTHVIYNVATVNANHKVVPADPWCDLRSFGGLGNYAKSIDLKRRNPSLKVLLTLGGWNAGSVVFSELSSSRTLRKHFIESALLLIQKHGFDGANINWQFPAERGGRPEDKLNYPILVQDMKAEFQRHNLTLSLDISGSPNVITDGYDIPALAKYADFINVNAFDYHGSWEQQTGLPSALYADDDLNVNYTISYLLKLGAPQDKLVLIVTSLARTWTLRDPEKNEVGSPAPRPGKGGKYLYQPGVLGYNELCEMFLEDTWTRWYNPNFLTPYAILLDQWVGYEDLQSAGEKGKYAKSLNLGGIGISSMDADDFQSNCGSSYPLLTSLRSSFLR